MARHPYDGSLDMPHLPALPKCEECDEIETHRNHDEKRWMKNEGDSHPFVAPGEEPQQAPVRPAAEKTEASPQFERFIVADELPPCNECGKMKPNHRGRIGHKYQLPPGYTQPPKPEKSKGKAVAHPENTTVLAAPSPTSTESPAWRDVMTGAAVEDPDASRDATIVTIDGTELRASGRLRLEFQPGDLRSPATIVERQKIEPTAGAITTAIEQALRSITLAPRLRIKTLTVQPEFAADDDTHLLSASIDVKLSMVFPSESAA